MATDYLHLRTYGARIRTVRMLKYDQGIRAGNTKLSKKAFSAAMKFSKAYSVRKEAIGKFTSDFGRWCPRNHYAPPKEKKL